MFDVNLIDWTKLQKPTKRTKLLKPRDMNDKEFVHKVMDFEKKLLEQWLYLPDEYRSPRSVRQIVQGFFDTGALNLCYEMGDFQGLVGFTSILPEYKCGVFLKIWDKELHGKELIRELIELSDLIMEQFKLRRMTVDTPDRRMKKFAILAGFKQEASQPMCFRWNSKLYTNYILAKLMPPEPGSKSEDDEGDKDEGKEK